LRRGPESVRERRVQLAKLVLRLRQRESPVEVDLLRFGGDVLRGYVRVDLGIDPNRPGDGPARSGQLGDRLAEQLEVELEPDRGGGSGRAGRVRERRLARWRACLRVGCRARTR